MKGAVLFLLLFGLLLPVVVGAQASNGEGFAARQSVEEPKANQNPAPEAFFRYREADNIPGRYIFEDYSLYHPDAWQWNFGEGGESNAATTVYDFSAAGTHVVCLTVSNPSGSDRVCDTVMVNQVTSLRETGIELSTLEVYPNPITSNQFNLKTSLKGAASLQLFDAVGRLHWSTELTSVEHVNQVNLPVVLSPGNYRLVLRSATQAGVGNLLVID